MTMLDGFIALLIADTDTNSLVIGRAYIDNLPRGFVVPALVIHRYGGSQDYDMAGPVGVREDQIQIDAYALNGADCAQLAEYIRAALVGFTGELTDGTVVQACYLERFMGMPFLPNADAKGLSSRSTIGFRVVSAT